MRPFVRQQTALVEPVGAPRSAPAPCAHANHCKAASSVHARDPVALVSAQAGIRTRYPTLWPHRDLVLLQQLIVLVVQLQRALAAALASAALASARAVGVARLLLVPLALGRQEVVAVVVFVVALLFLLGRVRRRRAGLRLPGPRARRPRSRPGLWDAGRCNLLASLPRQSCLPEHWALTQRGRASHARLAGSTARYCQRAGAGCSCPPPLANSYRGARPRLGHAREAH
jgi:hypothetical protein